MQFGITDTATVAIEIRGTDLLALKLTSIAMRALVEKAECSAGEEQKMIATSLDYLIRQIEVKLADMVKKHDDPMVGIGLEFLPGYE